jgi:Tol biopolymer transport system component
VGVDVRRRVVTWLVTVAICTGLLGVVGPTPEAVASGELAGRIAHTAEYFGGLVVSDLDGSNRTVVVEETFYPMPDWSPDGSRLAFVKEARDETHRPCGLTSEEIWTVNADGSGLAQLTAMLEGRSDDPKWSPDGSTIAYVSDRGNVVEAYTDEAGRPCYASDAPANLWIVDADGGSEPRQLLADPNDLLTEWSPAWSSDGSVVYFSSDRSSLEPRTFDIWRVDPSGSGPPEQLTFEADSGYALGDIDVSPADGSLVYLKYELPEQGLRPDVSAGTLQPNSPYWDRDVGPDLVIMDPVTLESTTVATLPFGATNPIFSPDGASVMVDHVGTAISSPQYGTLSVVDLATGDAQTLPIAGPTFLPAWTGCPAPQSGPWIGMWSSELDPSMRGATEGSLTFAGGEGSGEVSILGPEYPLLLDQPIVLSVDCGAVTGSVGSITFTGAMSSDGRRIEATYSTGVDSGSWVLTLEDTTVSGPGPSLTTDPGGVGATPDNPLQVSVASLLPGPLSIGLAPSPSTQMSGFNLFDTSVRITGPTHPIELRMTVTIVADATLTQGRPASAVSVLRNGAVVPTCLIPSSFGHGYPDPCVSERQDLPDGDVIITVLTSRASVWSLGSPAPALRANGRIVYAAQRSPATAYDIYVMDPDGSNPVQLTSGVGDEIDPVWSPDGTKIAFEAWIPVGNDGNREIFVMNADGSNQVNITTWPFGDDREPTWSPDGTRIAYTSNGDNGTSQDLVVMNADGSDPVYLTDSASNLSVTGIKEPAWSPDGGQIAFVATPVDIGGEEIFLIDADGSNLRNLTNAPGSFYGSPAWSPLGDRIVFVHARVNRDGPHIEVMNSDGTDRQVLYDGGWRQDSPAFSPDGTKIAFWSESQDVEGIMVMAADGTQVAPLTSAPGADTMPNWAPALSPSIGAESRAEAHVEGNGWLSTDDGEGDGATASDPIETLVAYGAATAGPISIDELPGTVSQVAGYRLVDWHVVISAATASPTDPLTIAFELDRTVLPPGFDPATFTVFRNGTPVDTCLDVPPDPIEPDPCTASVIVEDDGDLVVLVYSTNASTWEFGTAITKRLSVGGAAVVEGDTGPGRTVQFAVTLSEPATEVVTVDYTLVPGSAAAPGDFDHKKGATKKLTIKPALSTGKSNTVYYVTTKVNPDTAVEGDETFTVVLSSPSGGFRLAHATAVATVVDDDPGGGLRVSVGDASIWEGDVAKTASMTNNAKVWISLSSPATSTVTVRIDVTPGTATAGVDYKTIKPKTLTFKPGQWQKVISIPVFPDLDGEGDETVIITLSDPTGGATVGRGVGTVTILNDD